MTIAVIIFTTFKKVSLLWLSFWVQSYFFANSSCSLDTGRKLNAHKTFRRRPGCLLNVLCTFNLHPVSRGWHLHYIRYIFLKRNSGFSINENDFSSWYISSKFYTNFSMKLTYYMSQHKCFLLWFYNYFYLYQVFRIAWLINQTDCQLGVFRHFSKINGCHWQCCTLPD